MEKLQADFQLTDFKIPQTRRADLRLFGLKFNNHDSIVPLNGNDHEHNFKNTLSDSDQRLLAFAFFVVDLQNKNNLNNTIVVLDDPMSSFDEERKKSTIKVLRDNLQNKAGDKCKQLIVLTHERNFFKFLNQLFDKQNRKFLKITFSKRHKTSRIESCDIQKEFLESEHSRALNKLIDDLKNNPDNIDLHEVRKRLEHVIKVKYHLKIPQGITNNGAILSWYKDEIANENLKRTIEDMLPNLVHHDQTDGFQEEDLSTGDKSSIAEELLEDVLYIVV